MKIHEESKTPSFPFYAKDWLSDLKVRKLTHEERGIYADMLCYSWLDDLPADLEELQVLLNCRNAIALRRVCESHWYEKDNFLYNKKLEKIKEELVIFREKKSLAGKKGNQKRWKNKEKVKASHSDKSANRKAVANASPPIPSPSPINNISKDICETPIKEEKNNSVEIEETDNVPKQYGNARVNNMLHAIKTVLKLTDFEESQKAQRNAASNLVKLADKIGEHTFKNRFGKLASDDFHRQKMGSLNYIYKKIKGFVDEPLDESFKPKVKSFNTKKQ